jgi:uncharacterized membrane protein
MDLYKAVKILLLLLVLDTIWIQFFLLKPFSNMIQDVQGSQMTVSPFKLILAYIVLYLLILFTIEKVKTPQEAFILGMLVYGVYDSTNYATLKNWNLGVAIKDTLWGGVLFSTIKYI